MKILLDTNVLSELRKGTRADPHVIDWHASVVDDEHYLSVLTIGEIRLGIERLTARDERKARALESWLRTVLRDYSDRVLPVDVALAEEWGRLMEPVTLPVIDALLAATAAVHGLTVATRNVRDIARTGVPTVNPFTYDENSD